MTELIVLLCLSAVSAGVFLRMQYKTMLSASISAVVSGAAVFCLVRNTLPMAVAYAAGLLVGTVYAVIREKRSFADGLLNFCIGGCQLGLWTTFQSGLSAVCGEDIVLFLYSVFYLFHVPAVLLTFDFFSLPREWKTQIKIRYPWIPSLSVVLLLTTVGFSALTVSSDRAAIVKILLVTAFFWAGTAVIVLLVAYGQKQEQSSVEQGYYNEMRTFMNIVRSQRHDYNLHVQTVASLIAGQKWEECRSYVNALAHDTATMNAVLAVEDPAIAALIHNYRTMAAQSGITLLTDIRDDMSMVVTSAYETNKILGNLLQNALDELEQQTDHGNIELGIYKRGEYCLIRVSNRVTDREVFASMRDELFKQGFTTKQGHDGVGLSSIKALAKRVGGDVTAWLEEDTAHFVASIPMRLET